MIKQLITKVLMGKLTKPALDALGKILKSTTEMVRPDRKFPGNKN